MISVLVMAFVALGGQPPTVQVYVFTKVDPSGFVDTQTTQRHEAVTAVRRALEKVATRERFTVVDTPKEATILVEISGVEWRASGDSTTTVTRRPFSGTSQARTEATRFLFVLATLTVGAYTTDVGQGVSPGRLSSAAGSVASRVRTWLRDNRERMTTAVP